MAGPPSATPSFTPLTAAIYIFNLIVGTGALALPAAFQSAGWLLGTGLLLVLAAVSYVTAGWVVESMAACNGILAVQQSVEDHKIASDLSEEETVEERNYFDEESEQV
jgi:amino acid permease